MARKADPKQEPAGAPAESADAATAGDGLELGLVRDVTLRLSVELGATTMAVGEVMELAAGSVIELDRDVGDPADLFVNGKRIGRAEVTVEEERLAVRVVELASEGSKAS